MPDLPADAATLDTTSSVGTTPVAEPSGVTPEPTDGVTPSAIVPDPGQATVKDAALPGETTATEDETSAESDAVFDKIFAALTESANGEEDAPAAGSGTQDGATATDGDRTEPAPAAPAFMPPGSVAGKFADIKAAWTAKQADLAQTWNDYDAPGEKVLAGIVGSLIDLMEPIVGSVDQFSTMAEAAYQQESVEVANQLIAHSESAAKTLSETYGRNFTTEHVLGMLENGGGQMYEILHGKPFTASLRDLKPETLVELFQTRFPQMAKLPKSSPAPDSRNVPAPLSRGSASRTEVAGTDIKSEIIRDLRTLEKR